MPEDELETLPDWSLLAEISPQLIDRGIAVTDTLQAILPSILAVDVDDEAIELGNDKLKKLFRLSQHAIEYLLKTQSILIEERDAKNADLERKKDQVRKLIGDLMNKKMPTLSPTDIYSCPSCNKKFLTEDFLTDHQSRRHSLKND